MRTEVTIKILSLKDTWEWLVPAFGCISLLVSCVIISPKIFFWNDELYSYYLFSDHSFINMMSAYADKINNSPPMYFIIGWIWAKSFGSTELSLRLFSSLAVCIALISIWITLRHSFGFWPTTIATLGVFCATNIILYQNSQTRMYGMFLGASSLGLLLFDKITRASTPSWSIICINVVVHVFIVLTHLFGILYSGAILATFLIRDGHQKIDRIKIYVSIVVSWITLIPFLPSIINQAEAGFPRSWIATPTLNSFLKVLTDLSPFSSIKVVLIILVLIPLSILLYRTRANAGNIKRRDDTQISSSETSLLVFAYSYLAVPLIVFAVSIAIKPVFVGRYMIPSTISWTILVAFLVSCPLKEFNRLIIRIPPNYMRLKNGLKFLLLFLLLALSSKLVTTPVKYAMNLDQEKYPGSNDNKYGYEELPIVVQFSHDFITRVHYSPDRYRYFFILDWETALSSKSGLFAPEEFKHMEAFKRSFPLEFRNVVQSKKFLESHDRFLVLDDVDYEVNCSLDVTRDGGRIHCPQWLETRILKNSLYRTTELGRIDENRTLLLVELQNHS